MNPFTADAKQDVASNVRHELYILNAFLMSLEICSDVVFKDCEEEAASLIAVARERLNRLIVYAEEGATYEEASS